MEEHSETSSMNEENNITESVSTAVQEIRRTLELGKASFAGTFLIKRILNFVLLIPVFILQRMPMNLRIKITASCAEPLVLMGSSLQSEWHHLPFYIGVNLISYTFAAQRSQGVKSWKNLGQKFTANQTLGKLLMNS